MRSCGIRRCTFRRHFPLTVPGSFAFSFFFGRVSPDRVPCAAGSLCLGFGYLGRFFQADTGGTAVVRVLRPVGPQAEPKSLGEVPEAFRAAEQTWEGRARLGLKKLSRMPKP